MVLELQFEFSSTGMLNIHKQSLETLFACQLLCVRLIYCENRLMFPIWLTLIRVLVKELKFLNDISHSRQTKWQCTLKTYMNNICILYLLPVYNKSGETSETNNTGQIRELYSKAMQFMQFSATKNNLTSRKQNNPL